MSTRRECTVVNGLANMRQCFAGDSSLGLALKRVNNMVDSNDIKQVRPKPDLRFEEIVVVRVAPSDGSLPPHHS